MLWGSELYYWFNMGVPLFILISAELCARQDSQDKTRQEETTCCAHDLCHKFKKILFPYYVYLGIVFVMGICLGYRVNIIELVRYIFVLQGIVLNFPASFAPTHTMGHLWYITYVLIIYGLTPFLRTLESKWEIPYGKVLTMCLLMFFFQVVLNRLFNIAIFYTWFVPLYIAGYVYFRNNQYSEKRLGVYLFLCLISLCGRAFFRVLILKHATYLTFPGSSFMTGVCYGISEALSGVFLYFLLRCVFSTLSLVRITKILVFSDRCSYSIYLTHMLGILLAFRLAAGFPKIIQGGAAVLLCIPIGFLFYNATSAILKKI